MTSGVLMLIVPRPAPAPFNGTAGSRTSTGFGIDTGTDDGMFAGTGDGMVGPFTTAL